MWYFTPLGFYSVVRNRDLPDTVLVRTRDRRHLDRLQLAFPKELLISPVVETPEHDYPYRIVVPRQDWIDVARKLAEKIDYTNFKDEAEIIAEISVSGDRYLRLLHDLWGKLIELYKDFRPKPREIKKNGRNRNAAK